MALILPSMVGRSPSSMVLICCASKYGTGTSNYQQRAIPSTVLVCCAPKYCDGVLPSIVGRTPKYGTVRPCFQVLWTPRPNAHPPVVAWLLLGLSALFEFQSEELKYLTGSHFQVLIPEYN